MSSYRPWGMQFIIVLLIIPPGSIPLYGRDPDGITEETDPRAKLALQKDCVEVEKKAHFNDKFFKRRKDCSRGYVEHPGGCGPIVHHDIKYDNVMMTRRHDGVLQPTLIDFGAGARCAAGTAISHSKAWVPPWLTDKDSFSTETCWGYDSFGVGLGWLVAELLQQLDGRELICHLDDKIEAADPAPHFGTEVNVSKSACRTVELIYEQIYSERKTRHAALHPVREFHYEVHRYLRKSADLYDTFSSFPVFEARVRSFVDEPSTESRPEVLRDVPLTMPPPDVLRAIFEMMQKCPSGTGLLGDTVEMQSQCQFSAIVQEVHELIDKRDIVGLRKRSQELDRACDRLQANKLAGLQPNVSLTDSVVFTEEELTEVMSTSQVKCEAGIELTLRTLAMEGDVKGIVEHFSFFEEYARSDMVNHVMTDGETLLATAARAGQADVVKLLLGDPFGADPFLVKYGHVTQLSSKSWGSGESVESGSTWDYSSWLRGTCDGTGALSALYSALRKDNANVLRLILASIDDGYELQAAAERNQQGSCRRISLED